MLLLAPGLRPPVLFTSEEAPPQGGLLPAPPASLAAAELCEGAGPAPRT